MTEIWRRARAPAQPHESKTACYVPARFIQTERIGMSFTYLEQNSQSFHTVTSASMVNGLQKVFTPYIITNNSQNRIGHFRLPWARVLKRVFVRDHSLGNVFPLQVNFHANQTCFHMKGFARRLVLKQRHTVTQKWSIHLMLPFTGLLAALLASLE